jgi:hypothetical protein
MFVSRFVEVESPLKSMRNEPQHSSTSGTPKWARHAAVCGRHALFAQMFDISISSDFQVQTSLVMDCFHALFFKVHPNIQNHV